MRRPKTLEDLRPGMIFQYMGLIDSVFRIGEYMKILEIIKNQNSDFLGSSLLYSRVNLELLQSKGLFFAQEYDNSVFNLEYGFMTSFRFIRNCS